MSTSDPTGGGMTPDATPDPQAASGTVAVAATAAVDIPWITKTSASSALPLSPPGSEILPPLWRVELVEVDEPEPPDEPPKSQQPPYPPPPYPPPPPPLRALPGTA